MDTICGNTLERSRANENVLSVLSTPRFRAVTK